MKKTTIVVTVGRLYNDETFLRKCIEQGVGIFRTNLAHQDHAWHANLVSKMKKVIAESGKDVLIEADISGPKVRTGNNPGGVYFVDIKEGEQVVLTTGNGAGKIHVPYSGIHDMVEIGSTIYIDDASVQLKVLEKNGSDIICESLLDCKLGAQRTIVIPGKDFDLPTITEKDWKDLAFIAKQDVDYLGFSLVKNAEEVKTVKDYFASQNCSTKIISKIETPEGVKNFDSILAESDAIMIARGDMGVFLPVEKVPRIQYDIIKKCNNAGKFVIVATEMLNSMKAHPLPTRAEVNDIFTAVKAGSNAVMLSGETTEGKFPLRAVECMRKVVDEAEQQSWTFSY